MPTATRPSRFRLARDVRPSLYDLHLEPDLEAGTFRGEVTITLSLAKPRKEITLHAADLVVDEATVHAGDTTMPARVRASKYDETVTLATRAAVPAGEARVVLRYHAPLNRHLRGFYAAASGDRRYAFTQCEAADARRVMPCFDEPAWKARLRIAVTVAPGDTALSNAPLEAEEALGGGRRRLQFATTPPLSTYLLAVGVGPLEASAVRMSGDTPIRIWHVPGKGHLTEFALEAGAAALERLEAWFGIPYPYGKLDLVAVPDFEAGAMENPGAVFFRETLLLLDPATASLPERKRAAEVIAHELAHMWYGDLVTMAWWDDLWLNEAFATWMAYRVVDEWKPEWRMWLSFEHGRSGALGLDALANTHPIYAPVRSVAEATENFDLITYEKGAAVVRMLEHWLGPETFRAGVRLYMDRHRESNAVAEDLWNALAEASGQDVARVAQAWIAQPGFPLVTLAADGGSLKVKQERFFVDPRVPAAKRRVRWPVPLVLKLPKERRQRTLADRAQQTLALEGGRVPWIFGNAAAGGFYRVLHDAPTRAALLADLSGTLTAVERMALGGDQWALVRAGRAPIDSFLEIVDALGAEPDHDVLDGVSGALAALDEQVVPPGSLVQAQLRGWVARRFGPALEELGWTAEPDEPDPVRLRRAALVRLVGGISEVPAVLEEARRRLEAYLADRSALEPNLAEPVVALAARVGDAALYERYRDVVAVARTPHEQRRFLIHLASFRGSAQVKRTLDALLGAEIPTQDMAFVIMRLLGNPNAREAAWSFLCKRWSAIKKRLPPLMLARLVEATPSLREPRYAREVREFFAAHPVPEAARAVKQALERFRLNAELRKRTGPALARWLAER
ncbi:MAG: M1 family metallopeptidase [bacterium]|nr:M1 family metallopeptidase [bacterium]